MFQGSRQFFLSETSSVNTDNLSSENLKEIVMPKLTITISSQVFEVELYENPSAKVFLERLPLTIEMQELNGNEKYHNFSDSLPVDSQKVENIITGDLMLYGSNCLVLFYQDFYTSYSYTPIGRVINPVGLSNALGTGLVVVTIANL